MPKSTKYYTDPMGDTVPERHLSKYERLRDRLALRVLKRWIKAQALLEAVKADTIADINKLMEASRKDSSVRELGGINDNVSFRSFDGNTIISIDMSKQTEYDERRIVAQRLIMEAVEEMRQEIAGASDHKAKVMRYLDNLAEVATGAFRPRRGGRLDRQRIRDLKSFKVDHPKWIEAIKILDECERVIGSRLYLRVSHRTDSTKKHQSIPLNIANA